eukprot:1161206-Pelagomonas_calceolata.AAC.4
MRMCAHVQRPHAKTKGEKTWQFDSVCLSDRRVNGRAIGAWCVAPSQPLIFGDTQDNHLYLYLIGPWHSGGLFSFGAALPLDLHSTV